MRNPSYYLILACLLFSMSTACVYVPPVWDEDDEIHDMDQIRPGITTKAEVLRLLGEPDSENKFERKITYSGTLSDGYLFIVAFTNAMGGYLDERDWWISIDFDENNIVRNLRTSRDWEPEDPAIRRERLARLKVDCRSLLSSARELDAKVQLEMARSCSPLDDLLSWKWNCLSAHQELGEAQHRFAKYYLYGSPPVAQDLQDAYRWFRLADLNGYKTNVLKTRADTGPGQEWICCEYASHLEILVEKMTPDQIAASERLVTNWKPNSAECELETVVTTD